MNAKAIKIDGGNYETIKPGDIVSFYTCSNADRERLQGTVADYKDYLGLVVWDGQQFYELKKLVDIEILGDAALSQHETKIDKTIGDAHIVSVWQNQWVLISEHKYKSDALEVKIILELGNVKSAKNYVQKMDGRINKVIAPYWIN